MSAVTNVVGTGLSYYNILNGESDPMTYSDAIIGTAGAYSTASYFLWGAEIPYVGEFVMFYSAARVTWDTFYDLGANYGPLSCLVNTFDLRYK